MNINKNEIDMNNFERNPLFNYFMSYEQPRYSITIPIDITAIYNYGEKYGNLNACFVYAITKACNAVDNFKYRIIENKLYKYDFIHAGTIFTNSSNQIKQAYIDINQSLTDFLLNYNKLNEEYFRTGKLIQKDYEQAFVELSCIKWFKFTGLNEISRNKFDCIPDITWDKIEIKNKKATVNMAITTNHALIDGYHIKLFIDELNKEINKFKIKS